MGTEVLHLDAQILEGAHRALVNSKAGFDQAKDVAEDVRRAIGRPEDVARRVTEFADSWSVNRDRLSKSVGKLAEKLRGIIDSFDELDNEYGRAFSEATTGDVAGNAPSAGGGGGATARSHPPSSGITPPTGGGSATSGGLPGGSAHVASSVADGHVAAGHSANFANPAPAPASPVPAESGAGPVGSASIAPAVGVPSEIAGAGGVALGAGSAAAVGSLFRAWSGRSDTGSTTAPGASSRAAVADELRGMRRVATAAGTSPLTRRSVASLMSEGRPPGVMPTGMGGAAPSQAERKPRGKQGRKEAKGDGTPSDAAEQPFDPARPYAPGAGRPTEETR